MLLILPPTLTSKRRAHTTLGSTAKLFVSGMLLNSVFFFCKLVNFGMLIF